MLVTSHDDDITSGCDVLEIIVISISFAFIFTIMILFYYRKYLKLKSAYLEARNIVESIIVSFNRQLKTDELLLNQLRERVDSLKEGRDLAYRVLNENIESIKENVLTIRTDIDTKIKGLESRIEELAKAYSDFKKQIEKVRIEQRESSAGEEIDSAIPIKATKALEPLTETELLVLKILAGEGEKSSSEIKERINLTREHSARLLKKLYEEGYLERDVRNKPYKYRIKNEMIDILRD